LCRTPDADCADGVPCDAKCSDGVTVLSVSRDPATGIVTVKKGGEAVVVENGQYKGCDAYCQYTGGAAGVPLRKDGSRCGLSHADFCYKPCRCAKESVMFYYDGKAVGDQEYCPGAALPDSTKYTAVDNCGQTLVVTVVDGAKLPSAGDCGTITRTLSASCRAGEAPATKAQKFTYGDSGIAFTEGCPAEGGSKPVTGSSKCVAATAVAPVVTYMDCVFKAEYKLKNACGEESTKTVTACGACPSS
jgi:nitrite reductase/ring-hydroxylating ferredoxin subunit